MSDTPSQYKVIATGVGNSPEGDWGERVAVEVDLHVSDVRLRTRVVVPKGKTSVRVMLPVLRAFSEALTRVSVDRSAAKGVAPSCRAGCGACCRQLVPVTPAEAYALVRRVEAMPEPRRSEVLARFDAAREALRDAGLLEEIAAFGDLDEPEARRGRARRYFDLGLACPFLEEESCSVYADRPMVCREYLVSNDPADCGRFDLTRIRRLPVTGSIASAVELRERALGGRGRVALALIPHWVAAHPEPPPERTGPEIVEEVLRHLTGTASDKPSPSA